MAVHRVLIWSSQTFSRHIWLRQVGVEEWQKPLQAKNPRQAFLQLNHNHVQSTFTQKVIAMIFNQAIMICEHKLQRTKLIPKQRPTQHALYIDHIDQKPGKIFGVYTRNHVLCTMHNVVCSKYCALCVMYIPWLCIM